jgi:formate dehydrogenase subunit gamma
VGKFNGGQKAEAAFVGGGMVVMLVTGVLMRFAPASWINWQQGATLVHDVGFFAIGIGVAGHIFYALSRPEQMKSMVSGFIPRAWAVKNTPAWVAEVEAQPDPLDTLIAEAIAAEHAEDEPHETHSVERPGA